MSDRRGAVCVACGERIRADVRVCPHCGEPQPSPLSAVLGGLVGGVLLVAGLLFGVFGAGRAALAGYLVAIVGLGVGVAAVSRYLDRRAERRPPGR